MLNCPDSHKHMIINQIQNKNKMSIYVKRIIIHNRAPFEHIDLEFKDKSISMLTNMGLI